MPNTLAQEYQDLLYGLFQEHLFNLQSVKSEDNMTELVDKADVVEKCVEVLNSFGEQMASDERLKCN
jgi:hypothetical protein